MRWTARDARGFGIGLAYLVPSLILFEIRDSPQNRMTNGAVLGVFAQARARTQKMIGSVLQGQSTSQKALDDAVAEMNAQIDKYNKANK
jgi:sn-glycerol 3-phosphate transport system substrate-binding protein